MGLATDIYGEGMRIPPIRLVRNGELDRRHDAFVSRECSRER